MAAGESSLVREGGGGRWEVLGKLVVDGCKSYREEVGREEATLEDLILECMSSRPDAEGEILTGFVRKTVLGNLIVHGCHCNRVSEKGRGEGVEALVRGCA